MKNILLIEVSPREEGSASRSVANTLTSRLRDLYPEATTKYRDLAVEHLPHLDKGMLQVITTNGQIEAESTRETARLSDKLAEELLNADLLLISTPMWNFGIPSALKAWIDLVVRPNKTFRYTADGVEGLAKDKRAVLVLASGGVFTEGPWRSWDFVDPYLRQILAFIGITDVQTVRAEGLNIPSLSGDAIPRANQAVATLAL